MPPPLLRAVAAAPPPLHAAAPAAGDTTNQFPSAPSSPQLATRTSTSSLDELAALATAARSGFDVSATPRAAATPEDTSDAGVPAAAAGGLLPEGQRRSYLAAAQAQPAERGDTPPWLLAAGGGGGPAATPPTPSRLEVLERANAALREHKLMLLFSSTPPSTATGRGSTGALVFGLARDAVITPTGPALGAGACCCATLESPQWGAATSPCPFHPSPIALAQQQALHGHARAQMSPCSPMPPIAPCAAIAGVRGGASSSFGFPTLITRPCGSASCCYGTTGSDGTESTAHFETRTDIETCSSWADDDDCFIAALTQKQQARQQQQHRRWRVVSANTPSGRQYQPSSNSLLSGAVGSRFDPLLRRK
jgi:hypothetical protein